MTQIPDWAAKQLNLRKPGRPALYPFGQMELYEVITIEQSKIHVSNFDEFKAYLKKTNERGRLGSKKFVCRQIESGAIEVCRVK